MPLKQSEAIVLRSWPLREADLLVSFFTRNEGKLRGVARSAKKSRKRFGGALEPLTTVQLCWEEREGQELVRIDSCEVMASPLAERVDYPRAVALGHVAEVVEELLPEREANDAVFRLAAVVLRALSPGVVWAPLTYFDLWIVRLTGFLPELDVCTACGTALDGAAAFFHPLADGLMCAADQRLASVALSAESRSLAGQMLRAPLQNFTGVEWPKQRAADLRQFLVQCMERHIEKRLVTATMLGKI
jgi:DNA repair protein RecO (recombination protein O)